LPTVRALPYDAPVRTIAYCTPKNADAKAAEWLAHVRGSVAPRPHLVLDPAKAALLVVDMLVHFADPLGRCFLPASVPAAARLRRILDAWRRIGRPVVFTRHAHEGPGDLGMLGRFFSDYIKAGEPDAEIIGSLAPAKGEPVFRKTTYDAFLGTPLEGALRDRGVSQVVVTGVLTHMCVETTARAAFCRGFEVYVPVDATAATSEERHLGSLLAMADAVAVATSAEEVIAGCASRTS
jgi:bifunctional isochorismate lyase / aryl carrier protein